MMASNTKNCSVAAVFDSHMGVEEAVKGLQDSGLNMRQLSIVAKDFYTEEHLELRNGRENREVSSCRSRRRRHDCWRTQCAERKQRCAAERY